MYLIAVSVVSLIVTAYDKYAAGRGRRRIAEKTLFLLAALGGSGIMYVTMLVIRHKTRHKRFMLGLPAVMIAQAALYVFFLDGLLRSGLRF